LKNQLDSVWSSHAERNFTLEIFQNICDRVLKFNETIKQLLSPP
jgi:hypothetical protein